MPTPSIAEASPDPVARPVTATIRPGPAHVVPASGGQDREVEAIAAVSRALAPLSPDEVRRVLDWAGARFQEGGAA